MTSSRLLEKMLKPELLRTAKGLDKRVNNQEKATMFLFYLAAFSISAAFIF
jgi:hypothetical protein